MLVNLPIQDIGKLSHFFALFENLDEFGIVGRLNVGHLPFPKRIYISFHSLHVLYLQKGQETFSQQFFIEVFRIESTHILIEELKLDRSSRLPPNQ